MTAPNSSSATETPTTAPAARAAGAPLEIPEFGSLSLMDGLAILRRQKPIIATFVLVGPLAALIITALMPRIYEGDVTIKIDNERAKIVAGQELTDPVVQFADTSRYLTTLPKLVASRSLATSVVDSLSLDRDTRFAESFGVNSNDADLPAAQRTAARREQAIKLLTDNVTMVAPTDSRLATISFRSRNPQIAAQVANTYAEKFIDLGFLQHQQTTVYAQKILRDQVEQSRSELRRTEMRAIEYARQNNLIDLNEAPSGGSEGQSGGKESGTARSVTTASLMALNSSLATATAARISVEQRWRTAERSNGYDIPEAISNTTLQSMIQQRAQDTAKLALLRTRYVASQPDVVQAQTELATIERQINAVVRSIRQSIRAEYETAVKQEHELENEKNRLAAQTLVEQDKRVQLNMILRDANTLRDQLSQMLTRLNQVSSAADVNTNNMMIIDRAQSVDQPVSPNLLRNLIIGLVAGIVLGAIAAVLREMLDDTLQTPEHVETKLQIPLLGVTPWVEGFDAEFANPLSPLREAYNAIRAAVDFYSGGAKTKILMVTSSAPAEGKSTTTLALAQDFARVGRKVLLIDADTRRSTLHAAFNIPRNQPGLSDILLNATPFDDVAIPDPATSLTFLATGPRPANFGYLLGGDMLGAFLKEMRDRFDIIMIDSPPVMGLADAALLAQLADGVIFVVETSRAHHGQAKTALRRIRNQGGRVIGAVVSKYDPAAAGYTGGSSYYTYYSYPARETSEAERS
jgi:capsular exopolysaccharide synthesis family protein